jgi:endonuclease G
MNQPEAEYPSPSTGPARPHELNGTFLASSHRGSIPGVAEAIVFQVQGAPGAEGSAWARLELVLDGANLLPFHYLRTGDRMGRAVVKIQRDDGATGTGFLVAPDILLTNHHVLPDHATAMTAVAMANYEVSPPNDPAGQAAVSQIDPTSLFVTNADLDFTFCGVRGLDFLGAIPLDRERMHVEADQTVTIIQHPRGRPKEIALRENRVVHADGVVIQYSCDTEPGSSGSPVFNELGNAINRFRKSICKSCLWHRRSAE